MSDPINPDYYKGIKVKGTNIECIDIIEGLGLNYHEGQILKYLWRAGKKCQPGSLIMVDPALCKPGTVISQLSTSGKLEDLKKLRWYANRLIHLEEGKSNV